MSTYFLAGDRTKESIVLDLKQPDDRDLVGRLIARADVLVENFRAGSLARVGLDRDELRKINPRLVILSISGSGTPGP